MNNNSTVVKKNKALELKEKITITVFDSVTEISSGEIETPSWEEFCEFCSEPDIGEKDGTCFVRTACHGDRKNANMDEFTSLLIIDADNGVNGSACPLPEAVIRVLDDLNYKYVLYTSFSHTPEKPKYRIVFLLDRKINKIELATLYANFMHLLYDHKIRIEQNKESKTWSQPWYFPRCESEEQMKNFFHKQGGSKKLPVDKILKMSNSSDKTISNEPAAEPTVPVKSKIPPCIEFFRKDTNLNATGGRNFNSIKMVIVSYALSIGYSEAETIDLSKEFINDYQYSASLDTPELRLSNFKSCYQSMKDGEYSFSCAVVKALDAPPNIFRCKGCSFGKKLTVDDILNWIDKVGQSGKNLDGWIEKTMHLNNAETDIIVKAVNEKTKIGLRALNKDLKEKQEKWKKNEQEESITGDSGDKQIIIYDKTATIEAVELTSEALIKSENLYRYGSSYVSVINKNPESIQEVKRDNRNDGDEFPNRLFISPHTVETFRHEIEKVACFYEYNKDGKKNGILVPGLVIKSLMTSPNEYDKTLTGIIEHPYVDDDFKPITQRGYDSKTGLYCNFPDDLIFDYKKPPSVDYAKRAYQNLCNKLLIDFPFADEIDRVAAVSMFLTALQRKMIAGDSGCPGYEIDAPTQATGKTTLARTVSYSIYNFSVAATGWSSGEDEMGKHLLSILKEGHSCVLFDNLPEGLNLKNDELSKAMTSPTYSKRQLGINKTVTVPSQVLWLFTGNNVQIVGDFNTRVLQIRLDAEMEDPDKRRFKRPNIGEWCLKNRKPIIKSCMAIIIAAKNFKCSLTPSRFQEWDKFVRFPLFQITGVDIAEVFARNKLTDPKLEGQRTFLECWYNIYSIRQMSAKEVLDDVDVSTLRQVQQSKTEKSKLDLNDAIKDIFNGNLPSSQGFGKWLGGSLKGRIIGGYRMNSVNGTGRKHQNRSCWQVTKTPKSVKTTS